MVAEVNVCVLHLSSGPLTEFVMFGVGEGGVVDVVVVVREVLEMSSDVL